MRSKKPTEKESKVLKLLTEQFLTIKKVSSRLKISRRMVYKYIDSLKEKGLLVGGSQKGFTKPMLSPHPPKKCEPIIRLHGQEFHITTPHTTKHRRKVIAYKGSTIIIYPNSLRIFSKSIEFKAYSASQCMDKSLEYWNVFFQNLQDRIQIPFYKEGRLNVEMVNAHFEEYNSETGKWVKKQGKKRLQIRGTKDGLVWMEYDQSKKGINIEVKHPREAFTDAEMLFDNVFNSLRDRTAFTPKEATEAIGRLAHLQETMYADFFEKAVIPMENKIEYHLKRLRQEIRNFNRKQAKEIKMVKNQKRLNDFR